MHAVLADKNFRDLGGLPLDGARRLRAGRLYRGEGPLRLSAVERAALGELGLATVCDLRSAAERARASFGWPRAVRQLELDLPNDFSGPEARGWERLAADPSAEGAVAAMCASYASMPAALLPRLAGLVAALGESGGAALVHCTAGKDRTGVLVALLLRWLGCPERDVEEDYLRSLRHGEALLAEARAGGSSDPWPGFPLAIDAVRALVGVDLRYLRAALAAVDDGWGSLARYFAAAGCSPPARERLLERLGAEARRAAPAGSRPEPRAPGERS